MTSQDQELRRALEAAFGAALLVPGDELVVAVWSIGEVEVGLSVSLPERRMRAAWRGRQANRGVPLLLVSAAATAVRVLGPGGDEPIRELPAQALINALTEIRIMPRRQAAATLSEVLERRDRAGIPGVIVRGLLTKHVLARRLRRDHPEDWERLSEAAEKVRADRDWRQNLTALGYQTEELKERSHLLRYEGRPVAVVLPLSDAGAFSRATDEGSLPEGLLIVDCLREGVEWGVLAAQGRFRVFPAKTSVGAATGRFLEIDVVETQTDDWPYVGLLAPESLIPGGLLDRLLVESAALGAELRDSVEQQIRDMVLPSIARGLGDYAAGPKKGLSLDNPDTRKLLEDAALLLMFRILFFLYLESRGFLPLASPSYRPHSATQLLQDARADSDGFDKRATALWDRHTTLVHAMRTGNTAWGLPAYNGDLFSDSALVGAEFLEEAKLTDDWFGDALDALGFDPAGGEGGVDYGDLEISHLGLVYEGLLSLRLSLADQGLKYDERTDGYLPAGNEQEPEVQAGELFYQTTSGGRKAAGVYYTPQVIVRHLVDHAVIPALDEHLERIANVADRNPRRAAEMLFDFRVLDPAMGSAHFLADALDRIAERIGTFLAEHPLKPVIKMLDDLRAEAKWDGRIEDGDLFRRLVLKRCIYGVDMSGMAVEVAKVSLWLASFVPGLSLSYLGHNLRQGDALVGVADPAVLGDLGPMFALNPDAPIPQALRRAREAAGKISAGLDRTPEEVDASRAAEDEMNEITEGLVRVFDVWCAEPFGLAKARGWLTGAADKVLAGEEARGGESFLEPAESIARDRNFFHWPAEFPEVFMRDPDEGFPAELSGDAGRLFAGSVGGGQTGLHEVDAPRTGFDVVIGNPPWEEPRVHSLEFYALHDPGLRGLRLEADRVERVQHLLARFPHLEAELERSKSVVVAARRFFSSVGGYEAQGRGHTDLYKLFCERYATLTRTGGQLGVVLPRAAFLNIGSRPFRSWLFERTEVRRLDLILNSRSWAFPIHPQYTIALLTARREAPAPGSETLMTGPAASQLEFESRQGAEGVVVRHEQLARWTRMEDKSSYEVPLLPTREAARVFDQIREGPRFIDGYPGTWRAFPLQGDFNETSQRDFLHYTSGWPVWKGKCFQLLDAHGRDPAGIADPAVVLPWLQERRNSPRSAFRNRFTADVLADVNAHPAHRPRIAFRDISRATDSRTVITALTPGCVFLTDSAPYLVFWEGGPLEQAFVLGVMSSLPFDWQARRFVETHLVFFLLEMLCFPPGETTDLEAIAERAARLSCVDDRFASFADACGVECGLLKPNERDSLLAELDGLVARAYGLRNKDLEVVFSDFTSSAVSPAHRDLVRKAFGDD
jgi:hypothetical protein